MARRRPSSDSGISLDSLMDALTNVVAVLILVLILVQADVSRKVQKFFDDLMPATPEEIAQSKALLAELEQKQRVAEARLDEKPATPEQLVEEKRQIALLEKSLEENKELLADLEQVRALETRVRAEREAETTKTVEIQKEIARIEGVLDAMPSVKPDTPAVVNIPNSRPIPEDANAYHGLVIGGRVHMIDTSAPIATIHREVERRKSDWLHERMKVKGKPDKYIYDGTKIVNFFKTYNWGNTRGQKFEIVPAPTASFLWLVVRPDLEKGGTPMEELGQPGNEFARAVGVMRQSSKSVLLYRVHPQAFEPYLAARELTEKLNVAAGWELSFAREFRIPIPDLTVRRLETPPEKPPGGPPKPPTIKPKLD